MGTIAVDPSVISYGTKVYCLDWENIRSRRLWWGNKNKIDIL